MTMGVTGGWLRIRFFHCCRWTRVGRWWSHLFLRRWRHPRGGLCSWWYRFAISLPIPISWSFILPCRALIGCWGVLIGASSGWCLALELGVTKWARLLDVEPFLQTASMEEMAARSDHSTVHVLAGTSKNTVVFLRVPFDMLWILQYMSLRSSYLVADGADIIVLFQLCVAGCGEALDLVDSVSPEQEALPAQLGSEPDVIVGMHQDDCASHYAPLPKDCLWHTVAHHTHSNLQHMTFSLWTSQLCVISDTIRLTLTCNTHQELQQSVRSVNIVDNFIHVLHRSLAELLHHKENIDQQSTKDLQKRERGTFMIITSVI